MNRLKPLRQRFIAINMITITILLILVFAIIIFGNIQHNRSIAIEALQMLVNQANPMNQLESNPHNGHNSNESSSQSENGTTTATKPPPVTNSRLDLKSQKAARALPGLVLNWDEHADTGTIIISRNMDTDKATAQKIAREAIQTGHNAGNLSDYELSFLIRRTPDSTKIAFVDRGSEGAALANLLLVCCAGFLVSWGLFFFVVWRISLWAFHPVEIAWTQQRQFIADASHELKSPLTVILANMQILKSHREDTIAEQERWIDSSNQEALRMKKLVSDMLQLARNDANNYQPHSLENIDFSDLVFGAILSFESVALDHGLTLREALTPNLHLQGDFSQLQELVSILLDNACKYSPADSIIQISLYQQERKIHLKVHNKSEPLDDEVLKHLFERFYRADASRTRQTGGYGLGLAIADSICQCHHGTIRVYNEGDGLTFHVTLPAPSRYHTK